jgi:hypothetical protein
MRSRRRGEPSAPAPRPPTDDTRETMPRPFSPSAESIARTAPSIAGHSAGCDYRPLARGGSVNIACSSKRDPSKAVILTTSH